ncbi:hypothetical protein [Moraxella nasicaprae]|uniref:Uncharacterized protein n=1 Tax=Moraxella nasicaprae TaxID=2904122 RepID=A0ABY6F4L4_9GAMM|nr:hypothetical protein [Moraxella nasicaprae]UXZ04835.1 hypothetical protein LU297_09785 [Moraxella nasicaprae]
MNKHSKNTHITPEKLANPLTVGQYLILQGKRQELDGMRFELSQIKLRQNRQAGWIVLLLICVMVLMIAMLFVLTV